MVESTLWYKIFPNCPVGFLWGGKLACHHHDSIALLIAARAYSQYAFIFVLFLAQIKQFPMFFSEWILHKNAETLLKQELFHQRGNARHRS